MSRKRQRECAGKVKHLTQAGATLHKLSLEGDFYDPFHIYKCRFCRGWHVATTRLIKDAAN